MSSKTKYISSRVYVVTIVFAITCLCLSAIFIFSNTSDLLNRSNWFSTDELDICGELRLHYRGLANQVSNQSQIPREIQGWTKGLGMKDITNGCWTYRDHYDVYQGPFFGNHYLHECNR